MLPEADPLLAELAYLVHALGGGEPWIGATLAAAGQALAATLAAHEAVARQCAVTV